MAQLQRPSDSYAWYSNQFNYHHSPSPYHPYPSTVIHRSTLSSVHNPYYPSPPQSYTLSSAYNTLHQPPFNYSHFLPPAAGPPTPLSFVPPSQSVTYYSQQYQHQHPPYIHQHNSYELQRLSTWKNDDKNKEHQVFDKMPEDKIFQQFNEDDQICEVVETDFLTTASASNIVENPEKFADSEVDLHEDLHKLKVLAGAPKLYPEIVASNSVPLIAKTVGLKIVSDAEEDAMEDDIASDINIEEDRAFDAGFVMEEISKVKEDENSKSFIEPKKPNKRKREYSVIEKLTSEKKLAQISSLNREVMDFRKKTNTLSSFNVCFSLNSMVALLIEEVSSPLSKLHKSMKHSQADLPLKIYQVLELEMRHLQEIQTWQVSAIIELDADMQRFSRLEKHTFHLPASHKDLILHEVDESLVSDIFHERVTLRWLRDEDDVLCTKSKTYAIEFVGNANSIFLIPPSSCLGIIENVQVSEPLKSSKTNEVALTEAHQNDDFQRTVFIRNLPFDVSKEEVKQRFVVFGDAESLFLVLHKVTKRPEGIAFLEFKTEDALVAANSAATTPSGLGVFFKGRQLTVMIAVGKKAAQDIVLKKKEEKNHDYKNLYLAKEGQILDGTPAAEGVCAEDMDRRRRLHENKMKKLQSPNVHISRTRLVIYNLPKSMNENQLSKLLVDVVTSRATKQKPSIRQVMFLQNEKKGKVDTKNHSRGVAFVEFTEHEHAFVALRLLNNNPETFGPQHCPVIEFAVDNVQKLKIRQAKQHMFQQRDKRESEQQQLNGAEQTHDNKYRRKTREVDNIPPSIKNAIMFKKGLMRPREETFDGHMAIGRILYELQLFEEALISFKRACELEPTVVTSHFRTGKCLYVLGKYNGSKDEFLLALETMEFGENQWPYLLPQVYVNLGIALKGRGMVLSCCEYYKEAAILCPTHYRALKLLGSALFGVSEYRASVKATIVFATLKVLGSVLEKLTGEISKELKRVNDFNATLSEDTIADNNIIHLDAPITTNTSRAFPEVQLVVAALKYFTGLPKLLTDFPIPATRNVGHSYVNWAAKMAIGLNTRVPWMCKRDDRHGVAGSQKTMMWWVVLISKIK